MVLINGSKSKVKTEIVTKEKYHSFDQCKCGGPIFKYHDTTKNIFVGKCGYFSKVLDIEKETKKKMSTSIREAKGGISDEIIIQVRKMILEGYKNVEIQELLTLPRHTITRIKNGVTVCRDEVKKDTIPLTQEQVNLSKRKINVNPLDKYKQQKE